jgi:hypothetical protein
LRWDFLRRSVRIIGLPNPALWGVLAFLCNFVPYVGPAFVLFVMKWPSGVVSVR